MIFITVGTHEQGLDRLLREIDRLIDERVINEEVFAQIGYSKYKPLNYRYKNMIGYDEMDKYVQQAKIIITHGGPGSIFHPLQYEKIPIVVPRNSKFNEHVDDHQILFTKRLEVNKKVIGIYDIKELKECIEKYDVLAKRCICDQSNVEAFIKKFEVIITERLNI